MDCSTKQMSPLSSVGLREKATEEGMGWDGMSPTLVSDEPLEMRGGNCPTRQDDGLRIRVDTVPMQQGFVSHFIHYFEKCVVFLRALSSSRLNGSVLS